MKHIQKTTSPPLFEQWKKQERPTKWRALSSNNPKSRQDGVIYYSKFDLRASLLQEQGYICCYCNERIENDSHTKIEHFLPRKNYKNDIFNYQNLLASCNGGEKDTRPRDLHCDAKKESSLIPISPLESDCEQHFQFSLEGKIAGTSDDAKETISILNLDIDKLNNRRKEAIRGFIYEDEENNVLISIDEAKLLLKKLRKRNAQDKFEVYVSAICSVLASIS